MSKKLSLNGNTLRSGDPTLKLDLPWTAHPSIIITATSPGDLKWVYLALPLNIDDKISGVTVYYQNSGKLSFISQTRIVLQTTPDVAHVVHDDPTDLHSTAPANYTSAVGGVIVKGSAVLELRLNFRNTTDWIKIGAIEIKYN
jgi:hypothetical protein